jgi:hypothetical protein
MKARATKPYGTVRAFTGLEFVVYEWRPVPDGNEDEAKRLEAGGYLELQSPPTPVVKAKPKPKPRPARKKAPQAKKATK